MMLKLKLHSRSYYLLFSFLAFSFFESNLSSSFAVQSTQQFLQGYNLQEATTEKRHPLTMQLSQTFEKDPEAGLRQLHAIDDSVLEALELFKDNHLGSLVDEVTSKIKEGGHVFFYGAGSSGRVGVDLAAKWAKFWKVLKKTGKMPTVTFDPFQSINGIIAGGIRAFVRAREGFEDSEASGRQALEDFNLGPNDIAFSVSASGSARFNVGASKLANERGASVYYFYNSAVVPEHTQSLFVTHGVQPILLDVGPQAITGSTRLQAATIAEACLGGMLNKVLGKLGIAEASFVQLINDIKYGHAQINESIPSISRLVSLELEVFGNPEANFFKLRDETLKGYVTFIAKSQDGLRQAVIDTVETPPTFSTTPPQSIHDGKKKHAEFRAYKMGAPDNLLAWGKIAQRKLPAIEAKDVQEIILASDHTETVCGSYALRAKEEGNLVIGVLKGMPKQKEIEVIARELQKIKGLSGKVALIALIKKETSAAESLSTLLGLCDASVIMRDATSIDPLAISSTVILKETLNLISNGSMIGMGKVEGNLMIGMRAANDKLIDRAVRIIQALYDQEHPGEKLERERVLDMVLKVKKESAHIEEETGIQPPPIVSLVKTMIEEKVDFKKALEMVQQKRESFLKTMSS